MVLATLRTRWTARADSPSLPTASSRRRSPSPSGRHSARTSVGVISELVRLPLPASLLMAVFTVAKGGLMYEASIGGQKFSYTPL